MATTFDGNCLKEYIAQVENDTAEFIGAEFCAARLIGYISSQHEIGELDDSRAAQLLKDANHLMRLKELGHRYAKQARKPSPEMTIMVTIELQRERRMT
jgi:hypothetical protein